MNRKARRAPLENRSEPRESTPARGPDPAAAHIDLGNLHFIQGRLDEAIDCYLQAISLAPDRMDAHHNLCAVLVARGQFQAAAAHYEQILEFKPDYVRAYAGLARALLNLGDAPRALGVLMRGLKISDLPESRFLFVVCLQSLPSIPDSADMRDLIVRAMSEPWARPGDLTGHCSNLIRSDPEIAGCIGRAAAAWPMRLPPEQLFGPSGLRAMARNRVLRCLLENARNTDIAMERCLTNVRMALLEAALAASAQPEPDEDVIAFYCALSRQCFINEYVFALTDQEQRQLAALQQSLITALHAQAPIPVLWPVAVAAYRPLHRLDGSDALLARSWPEPVVALLMQQVRNPAEEIRLRDTIAQLTAIDDEVSVKVRRQYEENPYPQWVKAAPGHDPATIDMRLRGQFPHANFRNLARGGAVELLVAGCGTGQQLVDMAQRIVGANVLAIDLSLTSLCYARRQTQALGIRNIQYGQADILKLNTIKRTFDVIDCTGVLHHLGDPLAGWRVLLSLLRPDGVMRVALYSELARRHVGAARAFAAERGRNADADGIRNFRQDVLALPDGDPVKAVTRSLDFFSLGDCRDLVFHVQEHRFTLPRIKTFLAANDLEFLGFETDLPSVSRYDARFPEDRARTDLDRWHEFEQDNRATFGSMYQFWVQKRQAPGA